MAKKNSGGTSQNLPLDELVKQALEELYRRRAEVYKAIEHLEARENREGRSDSSEHVLEAGTA